MPLTAMEIMTEETFGPVVGIMKVENDEEALALMNDSAYGLVSAVFLSENTRLTMSADRFGVD